MSSSLAKKTSTDPARFVAYKLSLRALLRTRKHVQVFLSDSREGPETERTKRTIGNQN
jgi:hypothetical protein